MNFELRSSNSSTYILELELRLVPFPKELFNPAQMFQPLSPSIDRITSCWGESQSVRQSSRLCLPVSLARHYNMFRTPATSLIIQNWFHHFTGKHTANMTLINAHSVIAIELRAVVPRSFVAGCSLWGHRRSRANCEQSNCNCYVLTVHEMMRIWQYLLHYFFVLWLLTRGWFFFHFQRSLFDHEKRLEIFRGGCNTTTTDAPVCNGVHGHARSGLCQTRCFFH